MPTVTLALDANKKLNGISERDRKAYAKFRQRIESLGNKSITFKWSEPRSGPHHRRFFAILNTIFDAQDQFDNPDDLRLWLEVGSGHCTFVPGPTGKMVALPKSIAYDRLDETEFTEVENAVLKFVKTEHARRFLWAHMSDGVSEQMISVLLKEFES